MSVRWMAVLGVTLCASLAAAQESPAFKNSKDRISYAMGVEAGQQLRHRAIDLDPDAFARGLKDVLSGGTPLLDDEQVRKALAELQSDLKRREFDARSMRAEEARKASQAFLDENKTKEAVVTLADGLQYKILKPGRGRKPTDADTVECSYTARQIDGMELDSSSTGGSSPIIKVDQAILGVREALKLMPAGSKWQVFIPPALVSGPRRAMVAIPPDHAIIYEIELIAIK